MNLNDTFLERTDFLAAKLRVNVEELVEILGVSRSSLFGWRAGRREVSAKGWKKLEIAEGEAGLLETGNQDGANPAVDLEDAGNGLDIRLERMERQLAEMLPIMQEVRDLLDSGMEVKTGRGNYRLPAGKAAMVSDVGKSSGPEVIIEEEEEEDDERGFDASHDL